MICCCYYCSRMKLEGTDINRDEKRWNKKTRRKIMIIGLSSICCEETYAIFNSGLSSLA